jgi:hypothetical protein
MNDSHTIHDRIHTLARLPAPRVRTLRMEG